MNRDMSMISYRTDLHILREGDGFVSRPVLVQGHSVVTVDYAEGLIAELARETARANRAEARLRELTAATTTKPETNAAPAISRDSDLLNSLQSHHLGVDALTADGASPEEKSARKLFLVNGAPVELVRDSVRDAIDVGVPAVIDPEKVQTA